jgi:hypothetical protein
MRVCRDRLCSADVEASSFDVLPALQTLRIASRRRKGVTLKFYFIVVRAFLIAAAPVPGARALMVFMSEMP